MRRWLLSKKEKRRLSERIRELYGVDLVGREDRVEVVVEGDDTIYLVNGVPAFIELGETLVPHLKLLLRRGYSWLPSIMVDQGAVMPISRGADLMRPGVVSVSGSFGEGDVVVIVEPSRRLPLAVHRALYPAEEMMKLERGKVAKRLHHLGDRYWRMAEAL